MKKHLTFAVFLVLAVALVLPVSVSAKTKAGTKPGSFFYFFDKAFERADLFFTFNSEKKAEKALEHADERLAEAEESANENDQKAVETAMKDYQENISLAETEAKAIKDETKTKNLLSIIASSTSSHQEVLEKVLEKVPEEAKQAIQMEEVAELKKEVPEIKEKSEKAENKSKKNEDEKSKSDDDKNDQSKEIEKLKKEVETLKQKQPQVKVIEKITEKPIIAEKKESSSSQTKQSENIVTLPNGAVVEMDANGNVVRTIKEAPQQVYVSPEPTAVQISSVKITTGVTTAQIEWQTDKPTESKIFLFGVGLSSKVYNSESGFSTRHSVSVSGLKGDTNYSYEIEAIANSDSYKETGNFLTQSPPPSILPIPPTFSIAKVPVPGHGWPGWNTFNINSANGTFVFEAITIEMADPDVIVDPQTREGYVQSMTLIKSGWNYRSCDAINNAFLEWQSKSYPYPCPASSNNPIYLTMSNPTWKNDKIGLTFHPSVLFPPGTDIYYYKVVEQGTGKIFEYQK